MASKIKLKNLEQTEFEITHNDGEGAISISSSQLKNKLDEYVNVKDFGAVGDGVTDDTQAFIDALEYANANNKTVRGNREDTYRLTNTSDIIVSTSCDFDGAIIDVSGMSGNIIIRNGEFIDYTAGTTVFDAVYDTGIIDSEISGWDGLENVENSYVIFETTQPYYSYRDNIIYRKEHNRVTRNGKMLSGFEDFDSSYLSKVRVMKMSEKTLNFGNVTFNTGSRDLDNYLVRIDIASNVIFENVLFTSDDVVLDDYNPTFLSINYTAKTVVRNVYFERAIQTNAGSTYAYLIQMQDNYDILFDTVVAEGDGWGVTGQNDTRIAKYFNCILSRLDFHRPAREKVVLDNCRIGSWGIIVSIIGDLYVNNTTFVMRESDKPTNNAIITSRSDTGCINNGNLYVTDCSIKTDMDLSLFGCYLSTSYTDTVPSGSPLKNSFFDNITVSNLSAEYSGDTKINILPYYSYNNPIDVTYPYTLNYYNLDGRFTANMNYTNRPYILPFSSISDSDLRAKYNLKITMDNVKLDASTQLSIVDKATDNFKIKLHINNCSGTNTTDAGDTIEEGRVSVESHFNGICTISNSLLAYIDLTSTTKVLKPLLVAIDNCDIQNEKLFSFTGNIQDSSDAIVTISNSRIYCTTSSELRKLAIVKCTSNSYYTDAVGNELEHTMALPITDSLGETSGTFAMPYHREEPTNRFMLDVGGVLYPINIPQIALGNDTFYGGPYVLNLNSTVITLTRTDGLNLTVSQTGSDTIGSIYLV